MKKYVIKKCMECGSLVKVLVDCNCDDCGIRCCDDEMKELKPNSVDASFEKHVPTYEVKGDKMVVRVSHVMEEDHYIEWVSIVKDNSEETFYFEPGDNIEIEVDYVKGCKLYSYCNKHDLWMCEVE